MLNPFPELLSFSAVAPFLLRLAAAAALGYTAYAQIARRGELSGGAWVWVAVFFNVLSGLSLLLGAYTQLGALVGIGLSVVYIAIAKRYARAVPLCRAEYAFVLVICLSIMLSGAGKPAFDIFL